MHGCALRHGRASTKQHESVVHFFLLGYGLAPIGRRFPGVQGGS